MRILTLDIGGANTKKLVADFYARGIKIRSNEIHYFPFWEKKNELEDFLSGLKEKADHAAVTTTAELSDVFSDKREGVDFIVSICERVFISPFYLSIDKKLLKFAEIDEPLKLAAANYVASVYFLEKKFDEGILIDVGSTTTDILPFRKNETLYGKTDLERLTKNQLIYTGILRTPVNAIVAKIPFKNRLTRISSEYFAIAADVYTILGLIENYSCDTPDGRGKGKGESMRRIARLLCADLNEVGAKEVVKICEYVYKQQVKDISKALVCISKNAKISNAYICGVGKVLAREACHKIGLDYVDLSIVTKAYDNLPCMGLAEMVKDHVGS